MIAFIEFLGYQHFRIIALVWSIVMEVPILNATSLRRRGTNANIADTKNLKHDWHSVKAIN